MSKHALPRAAALLVSATLAFSRGAAGAPCGRPDIDLTFPFDGALDVPSNAGMAAHYGSPAVYDGEPVSVTGPDGEIEAAVSFDAAGSLLRLTPRAPLGAGHYQVAWPALRGVGGGTGRGRTTSFTVGSSADSAAPSFEGLTALDWDLERERDPCTDKLDDRFVFRLQVGAAGDDASTELLSLLVFETQDPSGKAALEPTPVALHSYPGAGGVVEVRRTATRAGRACFAALVQDLLGNVSGGGEREVCAKTKAPPFFDGCGVVTPGRDHGAAFGALSVVGVILLRRGRSARARRDHLA